MFASLIAQKIHTRMACPCVHSNSHLDTYQIMDGVMNFISCRTACNKIAKMANIVWAIKNQEQIKWVDFAHYYIVQIHDSCEKVLRQHNVMFFFFFYYI